MKPDSDGKQTVAWKSMLFVVFALLMLASAGWMSWRDRQLDPATVTIGDNVKVHVMIADTPTKRERGLAIRDSLAPDEGMYFIFAEPGYPLFWMKDMKFPIDILWLRKNELVDMTMDLQPPGPDGALPQVGPRVAVDRVLEVPAGFAARHGLRLGIKVVPSLDTVSGVR